MCGRGSVCLGWVGGVNAMTQFDFTGRPGGAQRASKITSVSHGAYFILCIQAFECFDKS